MQRICEKEMQQFEKEHINAVRAMSPECMVLLKNEKVLPLDSSCRLALYGSGARHTIKGGTGSGDVNVRHFVNVEEGLEKAGFEITTKDWLDAYDRVMEQAKKSFADELMAKAAASGLPLFLFLMGKVVSEPDYELPLVGDGNTAVYVLARNSGEGTDRTDTAGDIRLTETEIRDIRVLNEKYEKFILVLNVGGMVDLSPVRDVRAVLLMSQLGIASGDALADVLLGKTYPSGKLTMTWAALGDYPSSEGFGDPDDTLYREGIYTGYRWFDRIGTKPVYPFGYGLGYTTFSIGPARIEKCGENIAVRAAVKNTGRTAGKETVQVYYSAPAGRLDKPYQELAAFAKTRELRPGEEQELLLSFAAADMASFDEKNAFYVLEKGRYVIRVGNSSRDTHIAGIVVLDEDVVTERVRSICREPVVEEKLPTGSHISYAAEAGAEERAYVITFGAAEIACVEHRYSGDDCRKEDLWGTDCRRTDSFRTDDQKTGIQKEDSQSEKGRGSQAAAAENLREKNTRGGILWKDVREGRRTVSEFVSSLSDEQLAYLCIGAYQNTGGHAGTGVIGNAGMLVAGAAGETTHWLDDLGMESLIMADGPAGLRLSTCYTLGGDGMARSATMPFSTGLEDYLEIPGMESMKEAMKKQVEDASGRLYYQYAAAIPIGTALAQSWNEELCMACGDLIGSEMELFGINLWLAPGLNIQRSPLCGRNFEYYSEDPVVSGLVATAITAGVQKHAGCGTTIKHYMCNNQETNRYFSNSVVNERAIREIYLKGFEICVKKAQPHALMTSYNLINGEHTCSSVPLLRQILRDEWGFKGIVMSDWRVTASTRKNNGRYACASAAGCVKAGNDIVMPGGDEDKQDILSALSNPEHPYTLTRADLLACAERVCCMCAKLARHTLTLG